MIKIDKRISANEKQVLASLLGKQFIKYRGDEIKFRPAVYQAVGVFFDDVVISIENVAQPLDYYGSSEDVGILSVRKVTSEDVVSRVVDGTQINTPIGQYVQDVQVIDDVHYMSDGERDLYQFSYTKAIVFVMPDRQVVFEKDVWFSEDIFIYRGQNAANKIMAIEAEVEESKKYTFRGERFIESLAHPLDL